MTHIGCDTDRQFAKTCTGHRLVPMSTKRQKVILMTHNRLRNNIANGEITGYQKAANMSMLLWDDELAYLAELNVKQCDTKHDQCRSTERFKYAGQNIGLSWNSRRLANYGSLLKRIVKKWFFEHKDASMEYINSFKFRSDKKPIGHFTAVIQDQSTHIGCATAVYDKVRHVDGEDLSGKEFLLTCNYAIGNINDYPVYITGQPCSKCPTRKCHSVYKSLCES
ncbi:antigen 5 like allergen Cul n 1-like [Uranotaenia lowii]|uniref:antigen 5 like allergen Cul n 1-like n=1 Tax=Uranotaenia lowii TaxID=190385 RepID=UPI00247B2C36|nr:antigen 5 like allergen Cul n 1-like [Uranotaenia lowii]